MTRAGERKIAKKEQVNGGAGHVLMEALLNEEERGEHCRKVHNKSQFLHDAHDNQVHSLAQWLPEKIYGNALLVLLHLKEPP